VLNGYTIFKDSFFILTCIAPGALILLFVMAYLASSNGRMNPFSVAVTAFSIAQLISALTIVWAHQGSNPTFMLHIAFWVPEIALFILFLALAIVGRARSSEDMYTFAIFGALLLAGSMGVIHLIVKFSAFAHNFRH
jgi:hypothetical protein